MILDRGNFVANRITDDVQPKYARQIQEIPKIFDYPISDFVPSKCGPRSTALYQSTVFLIAFSSMYGGIKPTLRIFVA